jgi:colicin import membrane protein
MESFASQARAFAYALAVHVALILLVWFGIDWLLPARDAAAAGEPVQATLRVSSADLKKAQAEIAKVEKAQEAAPKPQPVPEPAPQMSPTPPQPKPQEQLDRPDTVDQQAISRLAPEPPPEPVAQEQEQRQRQEQAELTEDIARQQEVERRQRLLAYQEVRRQREAAERRTRMEEQRLQQLADLQAEAPRPAPAREPAPAGNRGVDEGLLSRYKAAMLQSADQNWNHLGAPELTTCKVRFTQIPGGEVINVEFMRCPYDAEGREFVERALKKAPMPYAGFEPVFMRQVELSFCFPREECER